MVDAIISLKKQMATRKGNTFKANLDFSFVQSETDAAVFCGILMYETMGCIELDPIKCYRSGDCQLTFNSIKLFMVAIYNLKGLNNHIDHIFSSKYWSDGRNSSTIWEKCFRGLTKYNTMFIPKLFSRTREASKGFRENRVNIYLVISIYTYWLHCIVRGEEKFGKSLEQEILVSILSLCLLNSELIDLELGQLVRIKSFWLKKPASPFPLHQLRNVVMLASIINNGQRYGNLIMKNTKIIKCITIKRNSRLEEILFHLLSPKKRKIFSLLHGELQPTFYFSIGSDDFGLVSYFTDIRLLAPYSNELTLINGNQLRIPVLTYFLTSKGNFYGFEDVNGNQIIEDAEVAFFTTDVPGELLFNKNAPLFVKEKLLNCQRSILGGREKTCCSVLYGQQ